MKLRIRFAKEGVMRYVGHLDLMRFFQKALRRADVPVAYSNGFHPHPLISFAAPLSVGVTSGGEYMDVVTTDDVEVRLTKEALDREMAEGMRIVSVTALDDHAKNAMAAVAAADYAVYFKARNFTLSIDAVKEAIAAFFTNAPTIPITKKTKKGERQIDLKPLVYTFYATTIAEAKLPLSPEDKEQFYVDSDDICFILSVSCGSAENIKPELMLTTFLSFMGYESDSYRLGIHRYDMKQRDGDCFVSLGQTP